LAPGPAKAPAGSPAGAPNTGKAKASSQRWRDFAPRLASAMALAPIVIFAIWQGGLLWQGLLTLATTIALLEWAGLAKLKLDSALAVAAAASVPAAQAAYLATGLAWVPVAVLLAFIGVIAWRHRLLGGGVLYVGAGYLGLLFVRRGAGGLENLLFVMLVVWANDVGAYAAGRLIGGRRMAPKLSPGKTWSGAGGGLVVSIAVGLGVAIWAGAGHAGQYRAEAMAAVLSVFAQAGDLLESALKRHSGRKDSGSLIPGHGGVLDRVDGLIAAGAVVLVWQLVWRGTYLWQ
jgi:phosphatidate cytidylyltransferase